jgi:hypothetical protein
MNAAGWACIEQLVLAIECLHPHASSCSIQWLWGSFPSNPDLPDDDKRSARTNGESSLQLIKDLRYADDGGIGIQGLDREQESAVLPNIGNIKPVLSKPLRNLLRRPPLRRRWSSHPSHRFRDRHQDLELSWLRQGEPLGLFDDVCQSANCGFVVQVVLPPAVQVV